MPGWTGLDEGDRGTFLLMTTLLDAALEYAARGWPVFPGHPKTKRPLTPKGVDSEGKEDGSGGLKLATTDAAQITAWWTQFPLALIGVRCGRFIGAFAVDFDAGVDKETGEIFEADQLKHRLEETIEAKLPETWCVATPRGGRHWYFQQPAGMEVTNRGGLLGKASRIDVRGDNGYVFLPPSARPDGKGYAWLTGPKIKGELPAKAPQALLDCILRQGRWEPKDGPGEASAGAGDRRGARASPVGGDDARARAVRAYGMTALDRQTRSVETAPEGSRNDALNNAALALGHLVGAGVLAEPVVRAALEVASDKNGLVKSDGMKSVRDTISSGLRKGIAQPADMSKIGTKTGGRRAAETRTERGRGSPAGAPKADDGDGGQSPTPRTRGFDVHELNEEYALVLIGSKAVVMRERDDVPIEDTTRVLSLDAFMAWFANKLTEVYGPNGVIKTITWGKCWYSHPERRAYSGIEFHPNPDGAPGTEGYFNLWSGFSVEPAKERDPLRYKTFRDHLLANICHGNEDHFTWLFGWFADMVQRPRERPGTAVVTRGAEGVGKTIAGQIVGSLFPKHYFLVDDARYVTGNFNAHMASCLLLQADEAVWAGDKAAEGRLKGLITSPIQQIEHKGIDPIRLVNYVRIMFTSNEDWVVPAGKTARRYAVWDVDPRCMKNTKYFAEMREEMDNGGREALLADLLAFDLNSVDLRQVPLTAALLEQKIRSLDSVESWWFQRLMSGATARDGEEWHRTVLCKSLFEDYLAVADRVGVRRKQDETMFGSKLHKLLPGIERKRRTVAPGQPRKWVYLLPPLSVARERFEAAVDQPVDWNDDALEPEVSDDDFSV
jgi:hypothetical protein